MVDLVREAVCWTHPLPLYLPVRLQNALQGLEISWGLSQASGDRLRGAHGIESPDHVLWQIMPETPDIARSGPAQEEPRCSSSCRFVDASESSISVMAEEGYNLYFHQFEVRCRQARLLPRALDYPEGGIAMAPKGSWQIRPSLTQDPVPRPGQ